MEQQITAHQARLTDVIHQFKTNPQLSLEEVGGWISFNRAMIQDFQHERLVHLWVTLFFGLLFLIMFILSLITNQIPFYIITLIVLVVLIFYIRHYFFLENSIQKIYQSQVELEELFLDLENKQLKKQK